MRVPTTSAELLAWLARHQLLRPDQEAELQPMLASFPDARALAVELIHRDWLTPYQANQALQGKGDLLILGSYRLRERVGEGAMGQVFKAWSTKLQQVVAVKTLLRELIANARAMDRFRQEIEAASQLDHPNIVKVRDADESDGRPYLVMDYVEGPNLSYLVKTQGPLPVHLAAECARQAALGLQHAFERGVVHRDIKPANLLITVGAGPWAADSKARAAAAISEVQVKVLDFGLARFDTERRFGTRLTMPGSTLGTVDYMAPEQAESARDADTRADVYGLGCTLHFLLTGQPPFGGSNVVEKLTARLKGQVPSVRAVRPEVPEGLEWVLTRMMARQPADRYQTPAEVAEALRPFTAPLPNIPNLEIEGRTPPAVAAAAEPPGIPLGAPLGSKEVVAGAQVLLAPPAHPEGAEAPPPPAGDGLYMPAGGDPFALDGSTHPTAAEAVRKGTASERGAGNGGPDLRLVLALVAGAAAILIVVAMVAGLFVVNRLRDAPKPDVHGPDAGLQLTEVFITPPEQIKPGERKIVIVKVHRIKFNGPVEVRVEGLPAGVRAEPKLIPAGSTAAEVSLLASFGIDPAEADIRVIATSKNLLAEKTLPLRVVADKKGTQPR
jgi:serine/threonine-protein kinase